MTDARAAHSHHLCIAPQELRVFWRAMQEIDPLLPRLFTLHAFDVPRSVPGRPGSFKDTHCVAIIDGEIQTASRIQNALKLQKPSFD
jgi:hypothetical protein